MLHPLFSLHPNAAIFIEVNWNCLIDIFFINLSSVFSLFDLILVVENSKLMLY